MNSQIIENLKSEISRLESELIIKRAELAKLVSECTLPSDCESPSKIHNHSSPAEKVRLFSSLFRGRSDVYARRFESIKTGKSGYQPACVHEWVRGICEKPRIKCAECEQRRFIPFNDEIIINHLRGEEPSGNGMRPFVAGIYALRADETCWFLAVDFDKQQWAADALAFLDTCAIERIPASLERSQSGNGGHVWIFFTESLPAKVARNLGAALMTKTLDRRPEVGLDSFDRFFPNQDTLPRGGLGNLIALPLQKKAREKNHSVFIDASLQPYPDQWAYLASIRKLERSAAERFVQTAELHVEILPVSHGENTNDEEVATLWNIKNPKKWPIIDGILPKIIDIVLSNQIFIDSTGLPAILRNRILRLASFSNPEFYQAQAMRLPTWGKPRILYCYEQFPRHIAIPIGCLCELQELLDHYKISSIVKDERNNGTPIDVTFSGSLYPEQEMAARALAIEENGILSATTAFGKTIVALWLIAERKVNTLILVHRTQLMDQWVERISQFLGVSKKLIGRIGGGRKKRTGIIDVAVIQSVSLKGGVEDWVKEYGQVIVDECHHISAYSFEQAIRASSARYKIGLSATLTRKDGQHPIVLMNLGPVRYRVNAKKQAAERSFSHIVCTQETDFRFENTLISTIVIHEVFEKLWKDEARNKRITQDVIRAVSEKRHILVLSERTEHLEIMRVALVNHAPNLYVLKGGLGKKQVKVIMNNLLSLESEAPFVILATGRYLGEGFDLPNLDTLFMTFPVSWKGTIAQYAGRLHREFAGKTEVVIYDYADMLVPVLARMYAKRLKGYLALGYSVAK
jgi:superfamily II DNA or RNA helicase